MLFSHRTSNRKLRIVFKIICILTIAHISVREDLYPTIDYRREEARSRQFESRVTISNRVSLYSTYNSQTLDMKSEKKREPGELSGEMGTII